MVGFFTVIFLLDLPAIAAGSSIVQHTFKTHLMCTETVPAANDAYRIVKTRFMVGCYQECGVDTACYGAMFKHPNSCYLYSKLNPSCVENPVYPSQKFRYKTGIVSYASTTVSTETTTTPTIPPTTTSPIPSCLNGGIYNASQCYCTGGYVGTSCERLMIDCTEGYQLGNYKDAGYGAYQIQPPNSPTPFTVQCNMNDGGGTIFMKNTDWAPKGPKRDVKWSVYKSGFGTVMDNHWLGLDYMHYITTNRPQSVFMEVFSDIDYKGRWRKYDNFRIDDEASGYRMTYSGSDAWTRTDADADPNWMKTIPDIALGDSMVGLNGSQFSTKDVDNDQNSSLDCANEYNGGWWYSQNCARCNPNGLEPTSGQSFATDKVFWHYDYGTHYIPFVEMMFLAM